MKSYKFIAIAALALATASCTSEDVGNGALQNGEQPLLFGSYISGMSRGAHVASDASKGYEFKKYGFTLYANVKEGSSETVKPFMNNQPVNYVAADPTTEGKWTYAPIKYWPTESGSTVDFYPVWKGVPGTSDVENIKVKEDKNNIPHTTFIVNDVVKDQSDFIWASPIFGAKRTQYSENNPVTFQFMHALTAFEFALNVTGIDETTRVAVESVTLSGYFAREGRVIAEATNVNDVWDLSDCKYEKRSYTISDSEEELYVGNEDDYYSVDNPDNIVSEKYHMITRSGGTLKEGSSADDADPQYQKGTIMAIPFADDYTVTLKYTVYTWPTAADKANGAANFTKETYTVSRDVEGVTLKLGYLYRNLISLNLQKVIVGATLLDWNIVTKEYDLLNAETPTSPAAMVNGVAFNSLAEAIAAVPTDGTPTTVKMVDDVQIPASEHMVIPEGAVVNLDLNGFTIEAATTYTGGVIRVLAGSELVLDDTSAGKTGGINAPNTMVVVRPVGTAKVTINGGTYNGLNYAVSGNGNESGSEITINGGTFTATDGPAVYHPQAGTMTINGGTFKGSAAAVELRAGTMTVNGGNFVSTSTTFSEGPNGNGNTLIGAAIAVSQHTTNKDIDVTINGGTFKGIKAFYEKDLQDTNVSNIKVAIAGGDFTGEVASQNCPNFISGGTFNVKPADEYLATGKTATYEGGSYVVK